MLKVLGTLNTNLLGVDKPRSQLTELSYNDNESM